MKKILIIEDNPVNLKLAKDILEAQGYLILTATTGGDGVKTADCNNEDINLILLDLKLPDISGIEVIKKLKSEKNTEKIPVIVVSAHAMENDIKAAKEAGCLDYITKPIDVKAFLERVREVVQA